MLKSLHKNDTQLTPFVATKDWELTNVKNEDLILMEHSGSDGSPVAVEYINYGSSSISINTSCAVAKENQSKNKALYRTGLKTDGIFYPDTDPINVDGTYQRMVYTQIKAMFYNNYRDPTKMWGTEKIDFDKSETKKFLSDQFELLDIPRMVFGEKMMESSVIMYNTALDNDYLITDDGNNNLFAGPNIFSHQQEIGDFRNLFMSGSDSHCDSYLSPVPLWKGTLYWQTNDSQSVLLSWSYEDSSQEGFYVYRRISTGSFTLYATLPTASVRTFWDYGVVSGSTDFYYVNAYNSEGSSSNSNTVSMFFPMAPTGSITLSVSSGSAVLSWSYNGSDQNGWNIYKMDTGSWNLYTSISTASIRSYTDTNVSMSVTYSYKMNAYNDGGTSSYSNTASIFFSSSIPPASSSVMAWWPFEDNQITYPSGPWVDVVNNLQFVDDNFSPGITYTVSGKVGNALRINAPGGSINIMNPYPWYSQMIPPSQGWTITTWFQIHIDPSDTFAWYLDGFTNSFGYPYSFNIYYNPTFNVWNIQLWNPDDSYALLLDFEPSFTPSQDTWYFLRVSYDGSTGKFIYQLDNGAEQVSTGTYLFTPVADVGRIDIVITGGTNSYLEVDELALWSGVLTTDQVSNLWNGGSGKTYPP